MPANTETSYKSVEVFMKAKENVASVRWTIDNFTEAYESGGQLKSKSFFMEGNMFKLKLNCPGFVDDYYNEHADDFLFFLYQDHGNEFRENIEAEAWLEDLDGNKYYEAEIGYDIIGEDSEMRYYFEESLKKQDLGTKIKLKDDTAIFCVEVKKRMPAKVISLPKVDSEIRQKLWDSYQRGLTNDIIIQVEDKELKISKTILAANSDVFHQMLLTSNCKEVQTGTIEIKETRYEVMKAFVEYMHRGEVDNLSEICDDLFVLAHKYFVVSLQEDCAKEMIESLTKENIFHRLKSAFLYDQEELKKAALKYVTSKKSDLNFRQILMSAEWRELFLSNESMANEITAAVFEKMKWFPEQSDDQVPKKRKKLN